MKYDLVVAVDPGTESVLVGLDVRSGRLLDYKPDKTVVSSGCRTVVALTAREYLRHAINMIKRPDAGAVSPEVMFQDDQNELFIVPRNRILVGIEDQYLWVRRDEDTGQVLSKFRAIKSLLQSATSWHYSFALLGVDSIEVVIPSWKKYCDIKGPDQKGQAVAWSHRQYGVGDRKTADAYCIAAYLADLVTKNMVE